jgi:pyrroline-5-carboxylate reductase
MVACSSLSRTIAFVGGGNMGSALVGGIVRDGWSASDILVLDNSSANRTRLAATYGVSVTAASDETLARMDVVVWAVKPDAMRAAAAVGALSPAALHISVVAGVRLSDICAWLGTARVVRAMPNTPAQVGAGVTGLFAGEGADRSDRNLVERIFRSVGMVLWVDSDRQMDAVTAVSGSGPAYFFHFLEGLQAAAERLGFSPEDSRDIVLRVGHGAIQQAMQDRIGLSTLRGRVTSKGGTTEAALAVLDRHRTKEAMIEAAIAACERATAIGAQFGNADKAFLLAGKILR